MFGSVSSFIFLFLFRPTCAGLSWPHTVSFSLHLSYRTTCRPTYRIYRIEKERLTIGNEEMLNFRNRVVIMSKSSDPYVGLSAKDGFSCSR